jgi:hypothetical protein
MKKFLLFSCVALFAFGCNNEGAKDAGNGDTTKMDGTKMADAKLPEMPFPLDHPYDNWQIGDPQHAVTVMASLKAYTAGDMDAAIAAFGDSVRIGFNNLQAKLSKDSLKAMFTQGRAMFGSNTIKMDDWESVISADKKSEWVTLWYKEYVTDKKGNIDSMSVVDDAKIENGKIVVLDQKTQKLGPAKKM